MVRDYELMYIARPDLDEEGLQAAVASVEQIVGNAGGTVVKSTSWGRRRLAYEVDHLRDGHYMLLHVRLDGPKVADVERALAIHDTVFRHLLVLREAEAETEEAGEDGAPSTAVGEPARQAPVAAESEDDGDSADAGEADDDADDDSDDDDEEEA